MGRGWRSGLIFSVFSAGVGGRWKSCLFVLVLVPWVEEYWLVRLNPEK